MTFPDTLEALLKEAAEGPVFVAHDDANDCPPHKNSGLAKIDTGRYSDWPIARLQEWPEARLVAFLYNHAPAILALVRAAQKAADYPNDYQEALRALEE